MAIVGIYLSSFTSENFSLIVNNKHTIFYDFIFKNITLFGEAWFGVPMCLYLFYKNKKWGIVATVVSISSSIVSQVNKHFIFENALRPALVLKNYKLNFVDGVDIAHYYSFPSGHTTFAFAIFTCLAFLYKKPLVQVLFLFCAVLVGFSRIYLLQHFLKDVYVGSIFGFFTAFVLYWIIIERKINNPQLAL